MGRPEILILSEGSQRGQVSYDITYIWSLIKMVQNKKQKHTHR